MNATEYIDKVCANNRLSDDALLLTETGQPVLYIDRHVDPLPDGLQVLDGVDAGLALLVQWNEELRRGLPDGVRGSAPLLVVDDGWMAGNRDAPPPHLVIALTSRDGNFFPYERSGIIVNTANTPFIENCSKLPRKLVVRRVPQQVDLAVGGAWTFECPGE